MKTHRELIELWPSVAAFAADLGVTENAAKQMRNRSSINGRYWAAMVNGAILRHISGVSLDVLAGLNTASTPSGADGGRRSEPSSPVSSDINTVGRLTVKAGHATAVNGEQATASTEGGSHENIAQRAEKTESQRHDTLRGGEAPPKTSPPPPPVYRNEDADLEIPEFLRRNNDVS